MTTGLGTPSGSVTTRTGVTVQVLVVEDDPDQRELITIFLRRAGCVVFATGRVDEATDTVARVGLHLAILDVHLPGGAGSTIAALIREQRPTCSVVMSSVLDRDAFPMVADILAKPFSRAEVLRLIPEPARTFIPVPRSGAGR